jgi:hypothetical protein
VGATIFLIGLVITLRFLYYYVTGTGLGHLQSLILSAVLLILGFQILLIGLLADVISGIRKLIEDLLYRVRSSELAAGDASSEKALAGTAKRSGDWER